MLRNLIWCEVSCGRCTRVANHTGYYSPERIKNLKQETKNWKEDDNYRILCPTCIKDIENHKNL